MANKHTSKQKNILDIFQKFFVKNNYFQFFYNLYFTSYDQKSESAIPEQKDIIVQTPL